MFKKGLKCGKGKWKKYINSGSTSPEKEEKEAN
jgi:hypothetical protein